MGLGKFSRGPIPMAPRDAKSIKRFHGRIRYFVCESQVQSVAGQVKALGGARS